MKRREFLRHAAWGSLCAGTAAGGYAWLRPAPPTVSIHRPGLPAGHLLRDAADWPDPVRTVHCETLILGSGAAALCAAWHLARNGQGNFLLVEGPERNGNNAARPYGEIAAPTGAHYLALPSRESTPVRQLLHALGILQDGVESDAPAYRETDLVCAPESRLYYQNRWQDGLLPDAPDADTRRFFALVARLKTERGRDGRRRFVIPIAHSSQDAARDALDAQTFARWLDGQGLHSPTLRWYLDYCCRDDYGQGIDKVSAFAGLHYFCARNNAQDAVLTWPEGLAHISEAIRRQIRLQEWRALPEGEDNATLRLSAPASVPMMAVAVEETADDVAVLIAPADGRRAPTVRVRARRVICAMPLQVAARVVRGFARYAGEGLQLPPVVPWLVANFHLRRFPAEPPGMERAWDNVVYGSPHLGYVIATHQLLRVARPQESVFTAYTTIPDMPSTQARRWLLQASDAALLEYAARDLLAVYGKRFWWAVQHVDVIARAHAMPSPEPGYLNNATLARLRAHVSRIVFAHSDLSGYSVFEEACHHGVRAAQQLLAMR